MQTEELDAMQAMVDNATPLPWALDIDLDDNAFITSEDGPLAQMAWVLSDGSQPDAAFICEAREWVPKAIQVLRALPTWISVTESLPKHGDVVLSYYGDLEHPGQNVTGVLSTYPYEGITHWMPLPAAPSQEKGAQNNG
jgi:hypothetical protein